MTRYYTVSTDSEHHCYVKFSSRSGEPTISCPNAVKDSLVEQLRCNKTNSDAKWVELTPRPSWKSAKGRRRGVTVLSDRSAPDSNMALYSLIPFSSQSMTRKKHLKGPLYSIESTGLFQRSLCWKRRNPEVIFDVIEIRKKPNFTGAV